MHSPLAMPRSSAPGPRILLVDDDPGVLKGLRGLLSDEGFSPVEARSAAEAVRLLDTPGQTPALMLLDLRMPGETGLELLARLPRPLPVPVVVLSGEASPVEHCPCRWWCSPARPLPSRPCRP